MPMLKYSYLRSALFAVAIAYAVICAAMFFAQRRLVYLPDTAIGSPESYGLAGFRAIAVTSGDGQKITGWLHPARAGYPTLLYFHGNGGNLSHRAGYFQRLTEAGFGVLGIDYRGYGESGGSPSEEGLYLDARAALAYAVGPLALPADRLIFYGESLGTGVAVQMAVESPAAALVLQSPFTSAEAIAQERYPWLPIHWLIKDRFDSLSKIARIREPLLLFHGEDDRVVPVALGRALFAQAPQPKQAIYYPAKGHQDFDLDVLTQALTDFCRRQGILPPGAAALQ